MKKILTIILALVMAISLVACVEEEQKNEENKDTIEIVEESNKITEETEDEIEKEKNEEESIKNEENDKVDETDENGKTQENAENVTKKGTITIMDSYDMKTASNFSGFYKVGGYSRMNFMGNLSFTVNVTSIDGANSGDIDLSKANLPENISGYFNYLYFKLVFENDQLIDWDLVDQTTKESVLQLSNDDLINKYFPETNFEIIGAGKLPEQINLSDYEIGKTYAFEVSSEENFEEPKIINDTDYPLLIISIKSNNDSFERQYKSKHAMPDNSFSSTYSNDGKYYVAIIEGNSSELLNSDECIKLDGYNIGDELDFDFEDYVGNNTDKTITLVVKNMFEEFEFVLLSGEILESSWTNDIIVKDIK